MTTRVQTSTTLAKYYEPKKQRIIPMLVYFITELKPKIIRLNVGNNSTELKMGPEWFQHDDYDAALKNIIYPENTAENEERTFDTIARYRASIGQFQNNFQQEPLKIEENSTETLIIALDDFVKQMGGELSFTSEDVSFNQVADRTACGVANMSSAHLLATEFIPTAEFSFLVDLDYQSDLARSSETMQDFILSFSNGIADVLGCPKKYVRVTSVQKLGKTRRRTKINFGLTTPNAERTQEFVQDLESQAEKGFPKHHILKHVLSNKYKCIWKPLISFFQLQTTDFDPNFDIDYRNMPLTKDTRGGLPYYLPIGWYRHALKVVDKYPNDKLWIGHINADGEWAVAFHGTHADAVKGITKQGLRITKTDVMKEKSVEIGGEKYDKPGLYVATHCNGGAHPQYTVPFSVKSSSNVTETYRVVFQCRVKPGEYTAHRSPVDKGHAWRFVDPEAIRPYGILIKNEKRPDPIVEDVSDESV